jgi:chemotaxis-related protein WspD
MSAALNDCWNKIGVYGDSSCKELAPNVHCRNCAVYSGAAADLLNGELPADYVARWTEQVSRTKGLAERPDGSALIFRVGPEWLALPAAALMEIASLRPIHSIPHRRNGVVLGVANVRGELLVCLSLRDMLGIQLVADASAGRASAAIGRLLVIVRDGARAACPVDEVHGIEHFYANELGAVPATVAGAASKYTRAVLTWQGRTVGLLDEQVLFHVVNRSVA